MAQVEHAPEPLDAVSAELGTYLAHADQTPVAASSVVDGPSNTAGETSCAAK